MQDWLWLILITVYGACVGSFLNVVIYRLPEGKSIFWPPSQCPRCGHRLAWYDNVPVLGWLWLRGRCRYCATPISVQYPIVEALTAAMFGGLYLLYYFTPLRPTLVEHGLAQTWPLLVMHLVLLAGLLACTVVDARYYVIPLSICWTLTGVALAVLPVAGAWYPLMLQRGTTPYVADEWFGLVAGATLGLIVAIVLLRIRFIPLSFEELHPHDQPGQITGDAPLPPAMEQAGKAEPGRPAAVNGTPEEWMAHPHPRREVLKEMLFLTWPLAGAMLGHTFLRLRWEGSLAWLPRLAGEHATSVQLAVHVLAGVLCGYLLGGALVWATRLLGTLAFGKEAMGLGDVHLLAMIGAVLGARDATLVFFLAPFLGLVGALVMYGLSRLAKGQVRVIPYGPYLAGAAVVMMTLREPVIQLLRRYLVIFP